MPSAHPAISGGGSSGKRGVTGGVKIACCYARDARCVWERAASARLAFAFHEHMHPVFGILICFFQNFTGQPERASTSIGGRIA